MKVFCLVTGFGSRSGWYRYIAAVAVNVVTSRQRALGQSRGGGANVDRRRSDGHLHSKCLNDRFTPRYILACALVWRTQVHTQSQRVHAATRAMRACLTHPVIEHPPESSQVLSQIAFWSENIIFSAPLPMPLNSLPYTCEHGFCLCPERSRFSGDDLVTSALNLCRFVDRFAVYVCFLPGDTPGTCLRRHGGRWSP